MAMFWSKTVSLSLCLSFVWAAVIPVQARIVPQTITESLNKDGRLAVYGPYRLLTEQERRWLLQAQKGGPQSKSLFQKTSTQAALVVLRYRPQFQGMLGVESRPWETDISSPLLIAMATGKITLADYFKKTDIHATQPAPIPVTPNKPVREEHLQQTTPAPKILVQPKPKPVAKTVKQIKKSSPLPKKSVAVAAQETASKPIQEEPEETFPLQVPTFFNPEAIPKISKATLRQENKVIPGSWAYQSLKSLQDRGILKGYPDGTFQGERPLTRDEFAAGLNKALEKTLESFAAGERVTRDDLLALQQLQLDFKAELAALKNRVSALEGQPPAEKIAQNPTYRFTVDLPAMAGKGISDILLEFPQEVALVATYKIRLLVEDRPVVPQSIVLEGKEYAIRLKKPATPSARIVVEVQDIPQLDPARKYTFEITVLPDGAIPAYYALSPEQVVLTNPP
jgi:outer membrane biosynthesis protein TonB